MCFIDLQKAYEPSDRTSLWTALARPEVSSKRMIKVILMFHDAMRARVQLDDCEIIRAVERLPATPKQLKGVLHGH